MRSAILHVAILACLANVASAQAIPRTFATAEAEGAAFARADSAASAQSVFAAPSGGTSDRRCARPLAVPLPGREWRSGEFIVRGGYAYSLGLQAGKAHKVLWMPLQGAALHGTPLLLRALRVGHPADSLRLSIAGVTRELASTDPQYGYPSTVLFPTAGQWVVIATAGHDWGCFILDVAEATAEHGANQH